MPPPRRVALLGTGLVGGSVGFALRRLGVEVVGYDDDAARAVRAKEAGAVDTLAASVAEAVAAADLVVVAVPVGQVADVVVEALDAGARTVTDVGSVKYPIVTAVEDARPDRAARFVGGHPMAGSEQEGLDGASADLFLGATWVLTPTGHTDAEAFAEVRAMAAELGAEAVSVPPELHDALVAVVSHVPQLVTRLVAVAVHEHADASRHTVRHVLLHRAEQRDVVEAERGARRARRELRVEVGRGGEDDAHDIIGSEIVAGEELLDETRGLRVDLFPRVLVTRNRASHGLQFHDERG